MKIVTILFILFGFTFGKILILESIEEAPEIVFPTLDAPDFEFLNLTAGCAGFFDCIEYVGAVIYNIGLGIIYLVLLLVEMVQYIFEILGLIFTVTFTGIEGAPWWMNVLFSLPLLGGLAIIVYKLIRTGSSED